MITWRQRSTQVACTVLVGLAAGLAAVAFHNAMDFLFQWLVEIPSRWPLWRFGLFVLATMGVCAFVTGILMKRFAPDAPGSGIPQVKTAYRRGNLEFSWRLIWVKFVGGAISIGSGSSLGREGPTIHIGAAFASKVSRLFGEDKAARGNAVCAGSAAGLAAAFGSPLAGVTLVLEEIAGGRNEEKFAGRALLAAALAASVVYVLTNDAASLPIGAKVAMSWKILWLSPVVALVAGVAGVAFQWLTLKIRARTKASRFSIPQRVALGALAGGLVAGAAFAVTGHHGAFGLGEQDMLAALTNGLIWQTALWLLVAKLVATAFCYGSGGCGGIFAPIIFFGAMAGVVTSNFLGQWLPLSGGDHTLLALVGMTACLGAVVRAPLTSILIVMEMTREFQVLPALMVAAVVSVFMNQFCFRSNFYDAALEQDGVKLTGS